MNTSVLTRERWPSPACADGAILGLPTERSAKQRLAGSTEELVKTLAALLDELILELLSKRSADEFLAAVDEVFPKYTSLVMAYGRIASTLVPKSDLARLTNESFSELEAEIREHAVESFGADMRDRAAFTVWTLRKIADILDAVSQPTTAPLEPDEDDEFLTHFLFHALRSRLAIDCLTTSMRTGRPIYPGALIGVADCLRSAVDAYAWIRQAADLRQPTTVQTDAPQSPWDDEDEQLANESMMDMAREDA